MEILAKVMKSIWQQTHVFYLHSSRFEVQVPYSLNHTQMLIFTPRSQLCKHAHEMANCCYLGFSSIIHPLLSRALNALVKVDMLKWQLFPSSTDFSVSTEDNTFKWDIWFHSVLSQLIWEGSIRISLKEKLIVYGKSYCSLKMRQKKPNPILQ